MIGSVGGLTLKKTNLNIFANQKQPTSSLHIPSLIGQPQVGIQRMIDPTYHKINLLLSQQDESQVQIGSGSPLPTPGFRLPTHRSRINSDSETTIQKLRRRNYDLKQHIKHRPTEA